MVDRIRSAALKPISYQLKAIEPKEKILDSKIAAKKLAGPEDLDLYFKPRPYSCHPVAVVAATAAIVAAHAAVIQASKRGVTLDSLKPIDLEEKKLINGLDIESLLKIREEKI